MGPKTPLHTMKLYKLLSNALGKFKLGSLFPYVPCTLHVVHKAFFKGFTSLPLYTDAKKISNFWPKIVTCHHVMKLFFWDMWILVGSHENLLYNTGKMGKCQEPFSSISGKWKKKRNDCYIRIVKAMKDHKKVFMN